MEKIEDVVLFQIDVASKAAKKYSQKELDQLGLGITVEQWVILKIVSEWSPLSQRVLAEKSVRDPASITRTLDLLEKKGLLMREPLLDNRRAYNITLTEEGRKFVDVNMKTVNALRAKSIEGFDKVELSQLSSFLKRIKKNME